MPRQADPATVLASWRAQAQQLRERAAQSGVARVEQVAGKSGIEVFTAMLAGELPRAPIGDTLDFVLIEAEPGRAVFQGQPLPRHYNPLGTVHGGWFATLLDSALGAWAAPCTPRCRPARAARRRN